MIKGPAGRSGLTPQALNARSRPRWVMPASQGTAKRHIPLHGKSIAYAGRKCTCSVIFIHHGSRESGGRRYTRRQKSVPAVTGTQILGRPVQGSRPPGRFPVLPSPLRLLPCSACAPSCGGIFSSISSPARVRVLFRTGTLPFPMRTASGAMNCKIVVFPVDCRYNEDTENDACASCC